MKNERVDRLNLDEALEHYQRTMLRYAAHEFNDDDARQDAFIRYHTNIEKQLTAYLNNELNEDDVACIEAHMADCAFCREELTRMRKALVWPDSTNDAEPVEPRQRSWDSLDRRNTDDRHWFVRVWCSPQLKGLTVSVVLCSLFFLLSGMFVVFTVVSKSEHKFCPPALVNRHKMKLRKPKVVVHKSKRSSRPVYAMERSRPVVVPGEQMMCDAEEYHRIVEHAFLTPLYNPLSTFSIDVDRAAYANVRRFLNQGMMPLSDAVRIEEMINYFEYDYPQPTGEDPFSISMELAECPWNEDHQLALVGLQGVKIDVGDLPPNNLTFLLDVSGSMSDGNKLPLLKSAMRLLVKNLRPEDRVSIVVYAGAAGLVLEPTNDKTAIFDAIGRLDAGGSTAGGAGIELAYKIAAESFIHRGNNRVILATDGDFNVGVRSDSALTRLIEEKRESGVFLTVLGFGAGNLKDSRMEQLADKGNGNYAYIDDILEAKKVLVSEMGGTLTTIAKDVKIQVEFNPAQVKGYRLIGYENRMMASEDFDDDRKDAGELGAGHTVTAIYELIPADSDEVVRSSGELNYQMSQVVKSDDLMTVKLRYKQPAGDVSKLITRSIAVDDIQTEGSQNLKFASAVAEFGLLLRDSEFKGAANYDQLLQRAKAVKGKDKQGYRAEFIRLVEKAQLLSAGSSGKLIASE